MLSFADDVKLYICLEPVDMRKSIAGLSVVTADYLSMNPQCGHVFIFYNKRRNKVKLLYWDINGFGLYYKQLEKGCFKIPRDISGEYFEIEQQQLKWLLAGIDFIQLKRHPSLYFSNYF